MLKPWELVTELEKVSGRKDKQKLVFDNMSDDFSIGSWYCYNSFLTFGVAKVPQAFVDHVTGLSWRSFEELLKKLFRRELTGHAARDAIQAACDHSTVEQWNNWYSRILLRDLKCGITESTINKVLEEKGMSVIPTYEPQLAKDAKDHQKKLVGKKYVDFKLNGTRVNAKVKTNGSVTLYSRTGKVYNNFEHIEKQFSKIAKYLDCDMMFDGEVMSESFNKLMTQIRRKYDVAASDATLWVFDAVPWERFEKDDATMTLLERQAYLEEFFDTYQNELKNVQRVTGEVVDLDTDEGQQRARVLNAEYLDLKMEGIMYKDPNAPYRQGRSFAWLKQKPKETFDVTATGFEQGEKGKKNEHRLGKIYGKGVTDAGVEFDVACGGGYTEKQRQEIWDNRDKYQGFVFEVEADGLTDNANGTHSLRFPQFVRWRGTKPGEKL